MSSRLKKLPPSEMMTLDVAASYLGYCGPDQLLVMEHVGEAELVDLELEDGRAIKVITRAEIARLEGLRSQQATYNPIERRNHQEVIGLLSAAYQPKPYLGHHHSLAKELLEKCASRGIACSLSEDTIAKFISSGYERLTAIGHQLSKDAQAVPPPRRKVTFASL